MIPGLGRSPGQGKGYPLQHSGLENSIDCIVDGVGKSRTQLSDFHFSSLLEFQGRGKEGMIIEKKKGSSWAGNDCIFSVALHERGPLVNFRRKFGGDVLNVKTM